MNVNVNLNKFKKLFQSSSLTIIVSFHELQELFLRSHFHGYLNDEELLLLYDEYSPKKIQIFLTRIVAGFHSETWTIQSVWQNLDSENVTFHYSQRSSKFKIALRATKDPLRVKWKPFPSYCEGWLICADITICFLDLGRQHLYLAWSAIKYLIMYMMYTAKESRSGIAKFFRRKLFNYVATLLLPTELPWITVLDLLTEQFVQYAGQGNISRRYIMVTRESML